MPTDSRSGSGAATITRNYSPTLRKGQVRLESTPFYLYSADARRRISEELPDVKLIAVIRDPIDRAYSNWMHLWVDGLEPEADFVTACHAESKRIAAGWAPSGTTGNSAATESNSRT